MDYFKIFTIIFMIIMTYLMFKIYLEKCNKEGFEGAQQSLGGVDDTNAINTLAQIAKQLMTGGVTVPGNINIKDGIIDIKAAGDFGNSASFTGGNKEAPYINFMNKADGKRNGYIMGAPDKFILSNNLDVGGGITASGRNILAELDKLNSRWSGDNLVVPGHLTVKNGSNFSGGRHYFKDEENVGRLRVGAAYGVPGIWGEDTGGLVQVSNFQIGTQRAQDYATEGMISDKNYDFIRSRNPSFGLVGPSNTGYMGMAWSNGNMYFTYLGKNQRWNGDRGALPY
jgi:hypothetical protein